MLCRSDRRPRLPGRAGLSGSGRIGTMFRPTLSGGIASGSTGEGSGGALNGVARLMPARAVPEPRGPMGPWFRAAPGWVRIRLSRSAQIPSYAAVRGSWSTGGPHVVVRLLRCSARLLRPGCGGVRVRSSLRLAPAARSVRGARRREVQEHSDAGFERR